MRPVRPRAASIRPLHVTGQKLINTVNRMPLAEVEERLAALAGRRPSATIAVLKRLLKERAESLRRCWPVP